MNRLSPLHKTILNSLAEIYSSQENIDHGKYFSKKKLRYILIHFKWNKEDAINAIENDQCYYWFAND